MQYLEQKAKDQYIKTIVSDDAPNINAEDNEMLRLSNEEKKMALKTAKARLTEKDGDIRKLAPLVEEGNHKSYFGIVIVHITRLQQGESVDAGSFHSGKQDS